MDSRKRPSQDVDNEESGVNKRGKGRFASEPLLKLLIPNVVAGHLIGKGGSYLNELKSKYGGHIVLSGNREFFPGTEERVVVVTGKVTELIDLNYYIMDNVLNTGREPLRDGRGEITKMIVTNEGAGSLIGKRGATMKQITEASGVKIMIADSVGDIVHGDRILTMRGTLEQRHEAAKLIIQKIAEEPTNMANTRTKYRSMDMPDSGDAGGSGGFRDDRRGSFRGGPFDDGPGDRRDRVRDADPYPRMFSQPEAGDRMFSSQHQHNDFPYQENTDNSIVGLIKTAAANMDKHQILAALTGAPIGAGPLPVLPSHLDNKPSKKTLKYTLELKVDVQSHKVGHLMGKGGKTVKDMCKRSNGARFAFEDAPRDGGESENRDKREKVRTVTVTGTFKQVETAFDLLQEKLDEFDQYQSEVFQPRDY